MKWQLVIAWRNLWRNPRRTGVILVSVVVGIWMMLFMGAIMWGMVRSMIDTSLARLTGHLQIHEPHYLNDPVIENSIEDPGALEHTLAQVLPEGSLVGRRVRISVVVNNARHSAGLTLVGSELDNLKQMTFLKDSILDGQFPDADSINGILVGRKLLEKFETEIGNKLILMSQDKNGETASMAFQIVGSYDTFLESDETGFAFVPIEAVQEFLSLGEAISEVSVILPDIESTSSVTADLELHLDADNYAVTPWQDCVPMVSAYIKVWDYFSYVWGLVVFMAMGLGLVNTLLMAVHERIREFGLVRALGTRPGRIVTTVMMESFLLLMLGLTLGNLLGFLAIGWLHSSGIDLAAFSGSIEMFGMSRMVYPEIRLGDVIIFNGLVFGLGLLVSLYPAIKAASFTPVQAMTHFK